MLQREAALWELQDRADGLLLHDEALEEVEHWANEHQDELTSTEQEFLAACRETQTRIRRERRNNFLIRGLAVVATIIMFVALSFYVKSEARRKESEQLSFGSIAQNLINEATHQKRNDLRVLLMRQAYLFNQRGRGNILAQVDNVLRTELTSPHFSRALRVDEEVMSVALSPDGQFLAFGSGDGRVRLFNLHKPTSSSLILRGHKGPVCSIAFSPDGQSLASGGWDKKVRLWDLQNSDTGPIVLNGHEKVIFSVAFSPDGQTLASGSWDKTVRLWDLQNLRAEPHVLSGHEEGVNSVAFSPDGQTLASGSSDGIVRLWDVHNPGGNPRVLPPKEQERPSMPPPRQRPGDRPRVPPRGQRPPPPQPQPNQPPGVSPDASPIRLAGVNSVAFSPDGHTLASGHSDNIVQLWNVQNLKRPPVILEGHAEGILSAVFSPDGQTLASGSWDRTVRLWDLQNSGTEPTILRGHDDLVFSVVFSPDGQNLVSGSGDKTVRMWDMEPSESTVLSLRPPQPEILPDPPGLREHDASGRFRPPEVQPPTSGSEERTRRPEGPVPPDTPSLHAALRAIKAVLFSQDSQTLLFVNEDGIGQSWDLGKPNTIATILDNHKGKATAVAFSPDRKTVAIGGNDGNVRLWNLDNSSAPSIILSGHTGSASALTFSPEGTTLASGGEDKTIRLWDLRNPDANPIVLRGHEEVIRSIAFNPKRKILASGGEDKVIRLWNVRFPEYPPMFCRVTRDRLFRLYLARMAQSWLQEVKMGRPDCGTYKV